MTGIIVGMEEQHAAWPARTRWSTWTMLNLLCTEGMRSVPLTQVQRLRFLNPALDTEFRRALEVLAAAHDSQKKTVSLGFNGDGKRTVKVGYVVENPIWKTSYRLVLDKDGKPSLQGWAIVENTSDEDWKDVQHGAGLRPADLVPDGPVSAAVHPAADGGAGAVRVAAAADLPGRPQRRPDRQPAAWESAATVVASTLAPNQAAELQPPGSAMYGNNRFQNTAGQLGQLGGLPMQQAQQALNHQQR